MNIIIRKKKIMTPIGVEADYWRITNINVDKLGMSCEIVLRLFYNKEAKQSIDSRVEMIADKFKFVQFFSAIALQSSFNDIYNAAYEYVKANSEFFADAITDDEQFEIDNVFGDEPESPTGDPSGPDLPPGETLDPINPSGEDADEDDNSGSNIEPPIPDNEENEGVEDNGR